MQLEINVYKLSDANRTNIKGKSKTQFWNKSDNKTDLDTKKEENSNHKKD